LFLQNLTTSACSLIECEGNGQVPVEDVYRNTDLKTKGNVKHHWECTFLDYLRHLNYGFK